MSTASTNVKLKYDEITYSEKVSLIITSKAYTKICFLTQKIHDVEWSALLFYTVEGHIDKPEKMVCKVEDIYLMDKGSSAFTSHNYENEDVIKAFDDNPEFMDMKLGHIHSHNHMKSFFSGTDTQELHDNADNHLYYLSLIVNNKGEMVAKLAYTAKREYKVSLKNKLGAWIKPSKAVALEEDFLVIHDCNITYQFEGGYKFNERYKEVIAKVKVVPASSSYVGYKPTTDARYYPPVRNYEKEWPMQSEYNPKIPQKAIAGGYGESTAKRGEHSDSASDYLKAVRFLKAIILADMKPTEMTLIAALNHARTTFGDVDAETIKESYNISFNEFMVDDQPVHFIQHAYDTIFGEDKFVEEADNTLWSMSSFLPKSDTFADIIEEILEEAALDLNEQMQQLSGTATKSV